MRCPQSMLFASSRVDRSEAFYMRFIAFVCHNATAYIVDESIPHSQPVD